MTAQSKSVALLLALVAVAALMRLAPASAWVNSNGVTTAAGTGRGQRGHGTGAAENCQGGSSSPLATRAAAVSTAARAAVPAAAFSRLRLASAASSTEVEEEPRRNPDRPELPELKGDFDWDEKFRGDGDWITGDQVPGKMVLNEVELAAQIAALDRLESGWRKDREVRAYEEGRNVGFVEKAETINGRAAMFFLATGLLTEYWTGYSFPDQVEEMLRVGGFIGFE
jgi:hypothetical protein